MFAGLYIGRCRKACTCEGKHDVLNLGVLASVEASAPQDAWRNGFHIGVAVFQASAAVRLARICSISIYQMFLNMCAWAACGALAWMFVLDKCRVFIVRVADAM